MHPSSVVAVFICFGITLNLKTTIIFVNKLNLCVANRHSVVVIDISVNQCVHLQHSELLIRPALLSANNMRHSNLQRVIGIGNRNIPAFSKETIIRHYRIHSCVSDPQGDIPGLVGDTDIEPIMLVSFAIRIIKIIKNIFKIKRHYHHVLNTAIGRRFSTCIINKSSVYVDARVSVIMLRPYCLIHD